MSLPLRVADAMDRTLPGWRYAPGAVAVSGGADSVALLRLLKECQPEGRLIVVHLNHLLRGAESDADEAFVVELAKRLNVEVRTLRQPVPPGNLEGEARRMRYEFFRSVAAEVEAGWIATGHTMDDQAETVLHRLIRGTGIQGLRGIHECSPHAPRGGSNLHAERGDYTPPVVRPLLSIRRTELREYLNSLQQPHREDSSNEDPRFTRNRIRRELLPLLETFNPKIAEVLHRLSQQAGELHDFAEGEAELLLKEIELPRAGETLVFDAVKLESLSPHHRRAVLRLAWHREGWPLHGMTFSHWERLANITTATDFPGGVRAERKGKVVIIRITSPQRKQGMVE